MEKLQKEESRSRMKKNRMFVGKGSVQALDWQRRAGSDRLNSGGIRAGGP